MSLEAAIMGFLAEEPRTGYDLKTRCFAEQAKAFWTADQAQIYRTLERLQATGMVASTRKRRVGKPDRRVYRLTELGSTELSSWLATPPPPTPPREPFQLQLFFSAALTDTEIASNLRSRRSVHQACLEELRREVSAPLGPPVLPDRVRLLRDAAFDGAIARERAAIDWLDDTIEAVESGRLPAGEPAATTQRRSTAGSA